jgi:hypothetical protein
LSIRTPLTTLLGITHPVIAAPMAFVSGGALAAAVSNAGGLGFLAGGYAESRDFLQRELRAAGNARVGVGFITWSLAERDPELLALALDHAPAAVWLSFGDAEPFAGRVKAAGSALILQVQSVAMARQAVDLGADVIVAQGAEAGGHGDIRSTLPLVPAVVDAVHPVPVVAAGGIADGRGLAAALMLGAAGRRLRHRVLRRRRGAGAPGGEGAARRRLRRRHPAQLGHRRGAPARVAGLLDDPHARERLHAALAKRTRRAAGRPGRDRPLRRRARRRRLRHRRRDRRRGRRPRPRGRARRNILSRMVGEAEALLRAAPGHLA